MRLYVDIQLISPYAMCAYIALTEKKLAFDMQTVDLAGGAQHGPEFARTSLTHRVPVLVDGGFALAESSVIVEYLDEAYPQPTRLFPADLRARARARQVQAWLRSDFVSIRQERSTQVVFHRPRCAALECCGASRCGQAVCGYHGVVGAWPGLPVRGLVDSRCGPGLDAQSPGAERRRGATWAGSLRHAAVGAAVRAGMGAARATAGLTGWRDT